MVEDVSDGREAEEDRRRDEHAALQDPGCRTQTLSRPFLGVMGKPGSFLTPMFFQVLILGWFSVLAEIPSVIFLSSMSSNGWVAPLTVLRQDTF